MRKSSPQQFKVQASEQQQLAMIGEQRMKPDETKIWASG